MDKTKYTPTPKQPFKWECRVCDQQFVDVKPNVYQQIGTSPFNSFQLRTCDQCYKELCDGTTTVEVTLKVATNG